MKYKNFWGASVPLHSRQWGDVVVESTSLSDAPDGDMVVYFGDPDKCDRPLVRIHSQCTFSEVLDVDFCDCAEQLRMALAQLSSSEGGILFYLRSDGRGVELSEKTKATILQKQGVGTYDAHRAIDVPADARDYTAVARFLLEKGIKKIELLTNSPQKVEDMVCNGIDVTVRSLYEENPNSDVVKLYEAKAKEYHHMLPEKYNK